MSFRIYVQLTKSRVFIEHKGQCEYIITTGCPVNGLPDSTLKAGTYFGANLLLGACRLINIISSN